MAYVIYIVPTTSIYDLIHFDVAKLLHTPLHVSMPLFDAGEWTGGCKPRQPVPPEHGLI